MQVGWVYSELKTRRTLLVEGFTFLHFQNPGNDKLWLVTTPQTSVASIRDPTSIAPSLKVDCSHLSHVNLWRHGKEGK